ncbi:MAG: hypothetical protein HFACDABA_01692 [Anaerolineales bacterium]|nr:hypothetical protein [Anaerolineales bacterium]
MNSQKNDSKPKSTQSGMASKSAAAEARFQTLFEQSADAYLILDGNIFVDCNQATVNMLKARTKEEVLSTHPSQLSPEFQPDGRPSAEKANEMIQTALEKGSNRFEWMHRRVNGEDFMVEVLLTPIPLGDRVIVHTVWRDIAERKQAQELLAASEKTYRGIFNSMFEALYIQDAEGRFLDVNDSVTRMYGYPREFFIGKTPEIISAPDKNNMNEVFATFARAFNGEPQRFEFWGRRQNGEIFPKNVLLNPGEFFGQKVVIAAAVDVTERKRAERSIRESEARFQTLFEHSADAYLILDGNIFVDCNQATVDMLGARTKEEVLSTHPSQLSPEFQPDGRPSAEKANEMIQTALEKGSNRFEWMHRRVNGEDFMVEVLLTPIPLGDHVIVHTVWRDITERKSMEREIQQAFEHRGYQVQVSTEIAQELASVTETGELFERVVSLTKERLGYYHTQLLRYDAGQDAVILVSGYGETGKKMLASGHKLPMGSGLIGAAAASGKTLLRPTLADDPDWRPNPLLPNTRGEIAVPIKLQNKVLGVLDVQSELEGALSEDDRLLLEGLCGQIAVAIEQTRLRQEMSERLDEINHLYKTMAREGWDAYRTYTDLPKGFIYDQAGVRSIHDADIASAPFTVIPMGTPGGEVVGNLSVAEDPKRPLSSGERAFLSQVGEQVALALEGARLAGQTQAALAQSERLFEASREITRAADLQKLVAAAIEAIDIPVINRAILTSMNYDADGNVESMDVLANWWNGTGSQATPIGTHYPLEVVRMMKMFVSPTPLFFDDGFTDERVDPVTLQLVHRLNLRAVGILPLHAGAEQIGLLLAEGEQPHHFTEEEKRLFIALGPQVATVMENRRQFERARRQAEREAMLNAISQKIQGATSVEAVLQIAARELGHALGAPLTVAQLGMK